MNIIVSILSLMMLGGIVTVLLTFGVALLIWLFIMAAFVSLYVIAKRKLNTWNRHVSQTQPTPPPSQVTIIEADYKDVSSE